MPVKALIFIALIFLNFVIVSAQDEELIVGNCNKSTMLKSSTGYLMALNARQKNNQVFGINQSVTDLLYQVSQKDTVQKSFQLSTKASSYFNAVQVPVDFSQDYSCPEEYRNSTQGLDLHAGSSTWLWRKGNLMVFYGGATTGTLMVSDKRLQAMGSMGIMMLYSFMNYIAPVLSTAPFGESIGFSAFPDWMLGLSYEQKKLGTISYGYVGSSGHMIDIQSKYSLYINTVMNGDFNAYKLLRIGGQDLLKKWLPSHNFKVYYEDVFLAAPPILDSNEKAVFSNDLGENLRGIHSEYAAKKGLGAKLFWTLYPENRFQSASAFWTIRSGDAAFVIEYGMVHTPDLYFYGIKPQWLHTSTLTLQAGDRFNLSFGRNSMEQFAIFPYSQNSWYFNYSMRL